MRVVIIGGNECMERRYCELCKNYGCRAKVFCKPCTSMGDRIYTFGVIFAKVSVKGKRS